MTPLTKYFLLVNLPVISISILLPFTSFISYTTLIYFFLFFFCIYWVSGNLYHLYWSHKQFLINPIFEKITAMLGLFVMVGDPINYAKTHRWHHRHSDTDRDLHSPIHGLFHSLIGWMFKKTEVPLLGVRDLINDRYLNFLAKHQIKIIWTTLIILFVIDPTIFSALIYTMVLGFSLEMITNGVAHDPILRSPKNNYFLAWTCLSTLHKNHHENSRTSNSNDPWRFIKDLLLALKLIKERT